MKRMMLLFALLAGLGLIWIGCSTSTDPSETPQSDLEDFGQYEATDEESADFGDPDLARLLADSEEQPYEDPVAFSPAVDSMENDETTAKYCLRMIWGNLPRDTAINELTDWSGSLTISRGAILVTHTIKFERGQDYLLPRYNQGGYYIPEELHWVSYTSVHIDGIATRLYVPPSITDDVVTVHYKSDQFEISFTIYDLEALDTLIDFGPGNAILFQAMRCEPGAGRPTRGHLSGVWTRNEDGRGIFYGRWMSSGGLLVGTVKGEWGVDSTGRRVFIGKWVDVDGRFKGFVKGTWEDYDCIAVDGVNCPTGAFRGRIFNAERRAIGILRGHYWMGAARPGGFFAGQWCFGSRCFAAP